MARGTDEGALARAETGAGVEDSRRAPRVAVRCRVVVRARTSSWNAETADLGPGGCQLLAPSLEDPGAELAMAISSPLVPRPLVVTGTVVWAAAPSELARLGVAFAGVVPSARSVSPAGWYEQVFARDAGAVLRPAPRAIPARAMVFLGTPPGSAGQLSPEQVRLLRRVGAGTSIEALRASVGAAGFERTLYGLLSRRHLTLVRAAAVPPARWAAVIEEAESAIARAAIARAAVGPSVPLAPPATPPVPGTAARRSPAAQALYEQGVELLVGGNAAAAEALFRSAAQAAPEDPVLRTVLRRFEAR
jgi:hypothetical protein